MPGNPIPLVTIIIPTYNYGHFIGQTLDSLLAQSYQNWECIIVDDGSTDNTSDVIAHYQSGDLRFKTIRQENQGLSSARNTGMKNISGKYIQFLDADDLLERRKIEHHVRYLEDHQEIDLVYGGARYFRIDNPDERRYSNKFEDKFWMPCVSGSGREVLHALLRDNIMVVSAPLIRREVIEDVGYFDTSIKVLEDWHYWIRCATRGARFEFLDMEETLSLIRWHPNSLSQSDTGLINELCYMRRKINNILHDKDTRLLNDNVLVTNLAYLGVEEMKKGNRMKGIYYLLRAGRYSPGISTKLRWCFSATVAPLAPLDNLEHLLYVPLGQMARVIYWHQISIR